MPGQAFSPTETNLEASTSTRNPFRTPRHSLRGGLGRPILESRSDDHLSNATSTSNLLSNATNVGFYGAARLNQAQGNIVHIHNQTSYLTGLEETLPHHISALHLAPSRPYVDSLPGSDAANSPVNTYTRLMMCQGHGYPLWNPKPPDDLPTLYISAGVRIGDVGVITPDGVFDYAFNIYLEAGDPINLGRTPPNFEPLRPRPNVRVDGNKWKSRSRISSPGITSVLEPDGKYMFECGANEGAALIIPNGASREDTRDLANIRDYASQYAVGWYQYLIARCGWEVANGSIYLITGCDKTETWGTAAFNTGSFRNFRMVFSPEEDGLGTSPMWDESGHAEANSGSSGYFGQKNQCIFLRGFRATLQPRFWAEISYAVEITSISEAYRRSGGYLSRFMSSFANCLWFLNYYGPEETLKRSLLDVKTTNTRPPIHPPDIIGLNLLQRVPDAKLALTHDLEYAWPEIHSNTLAMPKKSEILTQVYEKYDIQKRRDVVWPIHKMSIQTAGFFSKLGELWNSMIKGETIIEVSNEQERLLPVAESPGILYTDSSNLVQPPQIQEEDTEPRHEPPNTDPTHLEIEDNQNPSLAGFIFPGASLSDSITSQQTSSTLSESDTQGMSSSQTSESSGTEAETPSGSETAIDAGRMHDVPPTVINAITKPPDIDPFERDDIDTPTPPRTPLGRYAPVEQTGGESESLGSTVRLRRGSSVKESPTTSSTGSPNTPRFSDHIVNLPSSLLEAGDASNEFALMTNEGTEPPSRTNTISGASLGGRRRRPSAPRFLSS